VDSKDEQWGHPGSEKQGSQNGVTDSDAVNTGRVRAAETPLPNGSPTATGRERAGIGRFLAREKSASVDLPPAEIGRYAREQEEIIKKLERARAERTGVMRIIKHPLAVLLENPLTYLSSPFPSPSSFLLWERPSRSGITG